MSDLVAVAPGKAFLCGEYAVLEGGVAVVAAIDRLARARVTAEPPPPSPFVAWALEVARERFHLEVPGVVVDTSEFRAGDSKLGLGSSAATVTATLAVVLGHHRRSIEKTRPDLLDAALAAHARAQAAQGSAGSGADVAASVLGGLVAFARQASGVRAVRLDPGALARTTVLLFAWTGRPANTAKMVAEAKTLRDRAPTRYNDLIGSLREGSVRFLAAVQAGDSARIIGEMDSYGAGLEALGRASGTEIVTVEHRRVRELARALGGTAKPSGAGGGDLAVALLPRGSDLSSFERQLVDCGVTPQRLLIHDAGASIVPFSRDVGRA